MVEIQLREIIIIIGDNTRITSYGKRKRREIGESPVRAVYGEDPLDRQELFYIEVQQLLQLFHHFLSSGGAGGGASEELKLLSEKRFW